MKLAKLVISRTIYSQNSDAVDCTESTASMFTGAVTVGAEVGTVVGLDVGRPVVGALDEGSNVGSNDSVEIVVCAESDDDVVGFVVELIGSEVGFAVGYSVG